MDIGNFGLLELQTSYLQQDPTIQALCAAFTPYLKDINNSIKLANLYERIGELDENVIDELAWQFHVDFYDYKLPIEKKRTLIKMSPKLHKIKGTPQAIIDAATTIFGRTKLKEWFEYGGEPYYFKLDIDVTETGASPDQLKKLDSLINAYKNERSWLEVLNIFLSTIGNLNVGIISIDSEEIAVYPWSPKNINSIINYTVPIAQSAGNETIITYPKEAI